MTNTDKPEAVVTQAIVEQEAIDLIVDLLGSRASQSGTNCRVVEDHLKQFARRIVSQPRTPTKEASSTVERWPGLLNAIDKAQRADQTIVTYIHPDCSWDVFNAHTSAKLLSASPSASPDRDSVSRDGLVDRLHRRADQLGQMLSDPPQPHPDGELMRLAAAALSTTAMASVPDGDAFKLLGELQSALAVTGEYNPEARVGSFVNSSAEYDRASRFLHANQYAALQPTKQGEG